MDRGSESVNQLDNGTPRANDAQPAVKSRIPIPDADAQRRAMKLVTSVFQEQFDQAQDLEKKRGTATLESIALH